MPDRPAAGSAPPTEPTQLADEILRRFCHERHEHSERDAMRIAVAAVLRREPR